VGHEGPAPLGHEVLAAEDSPCTDLAFSQSFNAKIGLSIESGAKSCDELAEAIEKVAQALNAIAGAVKNHAELRRGDPDAHA
jgi:hypothetical protein